MVGTNGSKGGEDGARALPQASGKPASGKRLSQIENEMALREEEAVAQQQGRAAVQAVVQWERRVATQTTVRREGTVRVVCL